MDSFYLSCLVLLQKNSVFTNSIINLLQMCAVWKSCFEAINSVKLIVDEVGPMGGGDIAYDRGHYTFFRTDGTVFDHGK